MAQLGSIKMTDVPGDDIAKALRGDSYDLHRRNARALWGWAAQPPRHWSDVKKFEQVEAASSGNDADITVLIPARALEILRTAEEFFPETIPLYAVWFFGEVRREEIGKLDAANFDEDGIEIGRDIAKKRRRRHVPMNPTLKAWLDAYPFARCANWLDKDKAVRALAGWDVAARIPMPRVPVPIHGRWPKNAIRHTHASVEIANGATLEDLMFRFGHTDGPETLRSHYVGRYTKRNAVTYLQMGPHGTTVQLIAAA